MGCEALRQRLQTAGYVALSCLNGLRGSEIDARYIQGNLRVTVVAMEAGIQEIRSLKEVLQ